MKTQKLIKLPHSLLIIAVCDNQFMFQAKQSREVNYILTLFQSPLGLVIYLSLT